MNEFNVESLSNSLKIGALALGNFDGVHLGHRELIKVCVKRSNQLGLEPGLLTFTPHPKRFFEPDTYSRIYEFKQNITIIKSLGILKVFVKTFDKECSEYSSGEFLDFIFKKIKFKTLVVGFDFKFGKNRSGSHDSLLKWCFKNSVELKVIPCQKDSKQEKISSTSIKKKLKKGFVDVASDLLGEDYFQSSIVFQDKGLGKKIGFPTINLKLDPKIAIFHGVYLTNCFFAEKSYRSISNIGFRPTISLNENKMVLESHILDSNCPETKNGDLFKVVFKKFIRHEQKFANIDELKSQIKTDIILTKSFKN